MLYRTDDGGKWGAGKGSDLDPVEVDNNFWEIDQRVLALETSPPEAIGISSITVTGTSMTVHMSNGSTYGPFTLPIATFTDRGEWTNDTVYAPLDFVHVPALGLFEVLVDYTTPSAPTAFDRNAVDGSSNPVYKQVFGVAGGANYDIPFSVVGMIPGDGLLLRDFVVTRPILLPNTLSGSLFHLRAATSVETLVFSLYKNATLIGTVTFAPGVGLDGSGGQFGVVSFVSDVSFAINDLFGIYAPSVQDECDEFCGYCGGHSHRCLIAASHSRSSSA